MTLVPDQTRTRAVLCSPPVIAWTAHLAIVLAAAAVTVALTPERESHRPRFAGIAHYLVSPLATWDGGWYLRIAEEGYGGQKASAAFWPLYPLLLNLGNTLTGAPVAAIGIVLSNAAFLALLIVLFKLVWADYGQVIATRTVWLIALGPLAFFFSAVYTESLFLLLIVGAIALGRSERWTAAALVGAMATVTRNSGILVILPLSVMLVQQRGWDPRAWWTRGLQVAAAACMPLAFVLHLDRLWGDSLLTIHVQSQWARVRSTPWDTVLTAYHRTHHQYATGRHSCDLEANAGAFRTCAHALEIGLNSFSDDLSFAFVAGVLVLLPYALWRLLPRDSLYLVAGLAFPLFNQATYDPLLSMARYVIVLYPVYVALAFLLRWRAMFVLTLIVSTAMLCGFLALFAQRYFVA
jgi:Mannosyltransferase (PIG-V)